MPVMPAPYAGIVVDPALTPTQHRAMTELFGAGQERPLFDADLGPALRQQLQDALAPVAAALPPDRTLAATKGALARIHTCEGLWVAESGPGLAWSPPTPPGVVAHTAVNLAVPLAEVPLP